MFRSRAHHVAISLAVASVLFIGGCGDDDNEASTCDALQALASEVDTLASTDLVAVGTDGVSEQVDRVESALSDARSVVGSALDTELSTFSSSLTALRTELTDALETGESITQTAIKLRPQVAATREARSALATAASSTLEDCEL